jgi:serine protease
LVLILRYLLLIGSKPMRKLTNIGLLALLALAVFTPGWSAEWNPVARHPQIGAEANRLIVGFKATNSNAVIHTITFRNHARMVQVRQANTTSADAVSLAQRAGLATLKTRQLTPSMHVLFLRDTLRGAEVTTALQRLRSDASVEFVEVDQRRYGHAANPPDDPLFPVGTVANSNGGTGQWFMQAPTSADVSAVDAVDAWGLTTGNSGVVIADVDSGYRFDHPDLLRAGLGGRLLPGYDFVGSDLNRTTGADLGTFLIANDGDGWDPDPSDPGDWINASDQANALFPSADCAVSDSSWHGTRVAGVLGALTNNGTGVAGMTWDNYILPVRALGKCGGYDSDIITGMQWAAGMQIAAVPDNPYPADIINLSLGGTGSCPSSYQSVINTLNTMGVLVVASAGNESGPVDAPGDCTHVLAVAGLRNVGTKVGYSSFGAEVGIAAPAGNCVQTSGACLRSIDTTVNEGLTVPAANGYSNQTNPNLGTSFSAPIVSATAALMRGVNGNLTPAQLIARIQSSSTAFPAAPAGVGTCPTIVDASSGECACVPGQCGAGMLNTLHAVQAALKPIAAIKPIGTIAPGNTVSFDASHSSASCNRTIATYQWTRSGGITITGSTTGSSVSAMWSGSGTLTLTVTDSQGDTDTAVETFTASAASTTAPATADSQSACPAAMTVTVSAPTVGVAFSPSSVMTNETSTLTITLTNSNPFALTQTSLTQSVPSGLTVQMSPTPSTSCLGFGVGVTNTSGSLNLHSAIIPANASCTVTATVQGTSAGNYTDTVDVNALSTGPAGGNAVAASGSLMVTAPVATQPPTKSGGGAIELLDVLFLGGVVFVGAALRSKPQVRLKVRTRR